MRSLRAIASLLLALALLAGAAVHGARAAAMPMALGWNAESPESCGLCAGQKEAEAAANCALTCAALTATLGDSAALRDRVPSQPVAGAPAPIVGRSTDPEPDPPR